MKNTADTLSLLQSNIRRSEKFAKIWKKRGCEVTYLPVYEDGIVRLEDVKNAVRDDTILISIMTANNEIGTIQPVAETGKLVRENLRDGGQKNLVSHRRGAGTRQNSG